MNLSLNQLQAVALHPVGKYESHVFLSKEASSRTLLQNKLKFKERFRRGVILNAASSNSSKSGIGDVRVNAVNGSEPFRGKSGSVSFRGLTHQSVEETKLVSAPFEANSGSFLWVLGPVVLVSSLVLPRFFIDIAIEDFFKNEVAAAFYIGVATYLRVTDQVQKPYLEFSPKRWSLITGLRGYLTSAFFAMGLKICAPLFAVYVTWPVLGLPALVSVAPFLVGCFAQFAFERYLDRRGSSCWPVVPIIFEVYRIYQLTKAAHFLEKLMFAMKEAPSTPAVLERNGAFVAMIVIFQILGMVSLWSLLTFLQRLFPSRPVAENY